jgi:uncharacterized protein YdaU (DUF1376 family)
MTDSSLPDLPPLPWMKLYIGDFLASTSEFTTEETGAAVLLAMAQWQRGPLPHDPAVLARICKVTPAKFAKLWPQLARKFTPRPAGLCDEGLERVRQEALRQQEKQRNSARITNRKRYGKTLEQLTNHDARPPGRASLTDSVTESLTETLTESVSDGNLESRFQTEEKNQEPPDPARTADLGQRRACSGGGMAEQELRVRKILAEPAHHGDTDAEIAKITRASIELVRTVRSGAPLASDVPTEGNA